METKNLKKAVEILYNARINLVKLSHLPNECEPSNKKEAYEIQQLLANKYLSLDNKNSIIGVKIGCTNKEAQDQINVNEPFYGNIFSNYSSTSNTVVNSGNFFNPYVEPEFSFILNYDYINKKKSPYSTEDINKSIISVLPSIEIVDSRYFDWTKIGVNNLIADNAANAYWIYNEENININLSNFSNHEVSLYINNEIIEKGNSKNVLNNPINVIKWYLNNSNIYKKIFDDNFYISTGTCTKAIPIKKGDNILADFGKLGKVEFIYK